MKTCLYSVTLFWEWTYTLLVILKITFLGILDFLPRLYYECFLTLFQTFFNSHDLGMNLLYSFFFVGCCYGIDHHHVTFWWGRHTTIWIKTPMWTFFRAKECDCHRIGLSQKLPRIVSRRLAEEMIDQATPKRGILILLTRVVIGQKMYWYIFRTEELTSKHF